MKKRLSVLFAVTLIFAMLVGCGGGGTASTAPAQSKAPSSSSSSGESYLLRIGSPAAETQPYTAVLYDLEKTVEEKTHGAVQVEIYPGAQLGAEEELIRKTMTGTIEACVSSIASVSSYKPELNLFYIPFLYSDLDTIQAIRNSELMAEAMACTQDLGFSCVGTSTSGGTTIATTMELKSIDDFKNLKLRSPSLEVYLNIYEALGMAPTPMPYSEVFTAIQQGTVVGMESGVTAIAAGNYHEAGIKYAWCTNQIFGWMGYWMNDAWLNKLPAEYQTIVLDAFEEVANTALVDTWETDQKIIEANDPYICHVPTAEELAKLQELTSGVTDKYMPTLLESYGQDFMEKWFELANYSYNF